MVKKRKKSIIGWVYDEENYEFKSLSAWGDSPLGMYICILKNKKSLGKFGGHKVRIDITEL